LQIYSRQHEVVDLLGPGSADDVFFTGAHSNIHDVITLCGHICTCPRLGNDVGIGVHPNTDGARLLVQVLVSSFLKDVENAIPTRADESFGECYDSFYTISWLVVSSG